MDLKEIWQSHVPATNTPDITSISDLQVKERSNPLKKIKRRLKASLIWCAVIAVLYVTVIVCYPIWQIQALIGVALLFTIWAGFSAYKLHNNFDETISANNLLYELTRCRNMVKNWIRLQNQTALFVYPFNAAGGFLLGGIIGSGITVTQFISKPNTIWILMTTIVILTPLCYYLARWMYKVAYGKLIDQLNENIIELSKNE